MTKHTLPNAGHVAKLELPTAQNLHPDIIRAAFQVWHWLQYSETGFTAYTPMYQAAAVVVKLELLQHPKFTAETERKIFDAITQAARD